MKHEESEQERMEREAKAVEEARQREPVKAKLVRLLGELRQVAGGSARKEVMDELQATAAGLRTEETVGDAEKAAEAEAKKLEKEREKAEHKAAS